MKKYVLALPLLLLFANLNAQKLTVSKYVELKKQVLREAIRYGDVPVYKATLYELMAIDHSGKANWKDSLTVLYYRTGSFPQVLALTEELLKDHPGEKRYLRMRAEAFEALGDTKSAIAIYEKLFAADPKDFITGYRLAWNQYMLKRVDEAYATLTALQKLEIPEKVKVSVPAGPKKNQLVPLKAAFYNLLGLTVYDLHNWKLAIEYFDKALKAFPQFVSAKQNKEALELMSRKLQQKAQTGSKAKDQSGN